MNCTETHRGFEITFDFDYKKVNAIKKIKGTYFMDQKKIWVIPYAQRKDCDRFIKKFTKESAFKHIREVVGTICPLPELKINIPLKKELFPYQTNGVAYNLIHKRVIVADAPGVGKQQSVDSMIATPAGWVRMGDIKKGQEVFGKDGLIYNVDGVFPQGVQESYKIIFNDGSFTECGLDHLWSVRDSNRRRRGNGWIVKSLRELLKQGIKIKSTPSRLVSGRKDVLKWEIPICDPVQYPKIDFLISPYIFGAMLGDGCLTGNSLCISIPDCKAETIPLITYLLPEGMRLRVNDYPACPQYFISKAPGTLRNQYKTELKDMGLLVKSGNKFIPKKYLQSSVEQRIELLRGLMDTDGSAKDNRIIFHTKCHQLGLDVQELVFSLGGQCNINSYNREKEDKGIEYHVNIKVNFCPFHLTRKATQWWPAIRNYASKYISDVIPVGMKDQQCISITSSDNLYLTDSYIVTHNTSQAIATILAAKAFPCLIVCPSTIKENWKREWEMWTDERPIIMSDKVKTSWKTHYDVGMSNIFITNYESLTKYFIESINTPPDSSLKLKDITFRPSISIFKSIIIDESHRAKEGTARATKILIGLANGKEYRLLLTGTPVVNKPEDLITQLYILGKLKSITDHLPDLIDKKTGKPMPYKMFRDRYCDGKDKASNLKELNYRLTMNSFYRREKNEVLKDLPERMQQVLICDITNREEYQKAQDNFVKYLKEVKLCTDEQIKTKMRGEVMVRIGVLKQISARGKIEAVKEYIEEITDAGEKVGVFMNLREIAAELKSIFPKAVLISGSITMQERQANIDAFQRNKDVLISLIGIKAGGVGLTLTAASRCAFIEFPWHDADCDQCISRFDRIGQQFSVMATFFLGRNTIDEWCYDLIQQKKSIAQAITGDTYIIQDKFIDDLLNLFNKKA